jgi:hypothetical protein
LHEVGGELVKVTGLDPIDTTEAPEESPKHPDILKVHNVAADAHPID